MLNKLQQRKQDGFTIIEVMIVLAIAGLIMLIVFLAVPALNRSSHNTSIKNDVSGILGAVSEYSNNNNGAVVPPQGELVDTGVAYVGGTKANCTAAASTLNCAQAKVSANTTHAKIVTTVPSRPTLGTVVIITGADCDGNTPHTGADVAPRSVAAYFTLEGGAVQCQQS